MQYSLTFLCSILLLPALAAAGNHTTTRGNSTTPAPSTITGFSTLIPTHSYPNGTTNGTSTMSVSTSNSTATITASESLSTSTSLVVVTGSATSTKPTAAATTASSTRAAGDAVKKVGNSVGAFAVAIGVLFVGHLL